MSKWIPAREALRLVQSKSPYGHAKDIILRRAQAGALEAVASHFGPAGAMNRDAYVPSDFWAGVGGPHLDEDWETGDFDSGGLDEITVRALGVMFRRSDIEAIPGGTDRSRNSVDGTASSGRPRGSAWATWVAELVAHVRVNGVPAGTGSQGQEALLNAVENALAARGTDAPSRASVQPVVQATLDRLRETTVTPDAAPRRPPNRRK